MFALIDCNSFFASCERVFRPELIGMPVVVLSNNDGCIIALTKEAKDLGIKMGAPYFQVKDFCTKKNVTIFSSNFSLYTNLSKRIVSVVRDHAEHVLEYSIDEVFVDLKGFEIDSLNEWARLVRKEILKLTGVPVSIGIAKTKTLAKLVNSYVKKYEESKGFHVLIEKKSIEDLLKSTPVEKVWGIGRQQTKKCHLFGIKSARDYTLKDQLFIEKSFTKTGLQTWLELKEETCIDLKNYSSHKSLSASRSFAKPVLSYQGLESALTFFVSKLALKLRQENLVTYNLFIYARTSPFSLVGQHRIMFGKKFDEGISSSRVLINHARDLLKESYRPGIQYKKAGVFFTSLSSSKENQISLFSPITPDDYFLDQVIDEINFRYGEQVLFFGRQNKKNKEIWKMNRNFKSPNYTGDWKEIPLFY